MTLCATGSRKWTPSWSGGTTSLKACPDKCHFAYDSTSTHHFTRSRHDNIRHGQARCRDREAEFPAGRPVTLCHLGTDDVAYPRDGKAAQGQQRVQEVCHPHRAVPFQGRDRGLDDGRLAATRR